MTVARETAVTEEVSYETRDCDVCGTETAVDPDAPADTLEPHGYAVVLGEGRFRRDVEHEGNWDVELQFELDESDSRLPTVEGYVVCEDCAQSIHGHPETARAYTGSVPRELRPTGVDASALDQRTVLAVVAAVVVVLLLVVLLV